MTVADLIAALEMQDPNAEVRLATQPAWPFENEIGSVEQVDLTEDGEEARVVYLAESAQIGYLPEEAKEAFGW